MFHRLLKQERGNGVLRNLWVAYRRIKDLENDQIAFAFFCSDRSGSASYDTRDTALAFLPRVYGLYQHRHVAYAARLILQAVGLDLPPWAAKALAWGGVGYMRVRSATMKLERRARELFRRRPTVQPVKTAG
jgi:hypothetical protein